MKFKKLLVLFIFSSLLSINLKAQELKKVGIQLYSLRQDIPNNVDKVFAHLSKTGYNYVEGYGYDSKTGFFGLNAKEYKAVLKKYKLKTPSAHYDFREWEKSQNDEIIKDYIRVAKILKQEYVTVPSIDKEIFKTEAGIKAFAAKLNRAGAMLKKEGLKLAYHNHSFEFDQFGDKTGYEILLAETNPDLVDFELDIYWAVRAKQDVIGLFKKFPKRFTMWHIKDMSKTNQGRNTEVGNGTIDYKAFLKEAKLAGLKYAFVEQESYDIERLESVKRSYDYLKSIR